jgi:predicted RNA-binding Zn-ribbon protein involved in translation (DUF1610 family)
MNNKAKVALTETRTIGHIRCCACGILIEPEKDLSSIVWSLDCPKCGAHLEVYASVEYFCRVQEDTP